MSESVSLEDRKVRLRSSSKVVDYSIEWTIENFSYYGNLEDEYKYILSPPFPTGNKSNAWRLKLFPDGNYEDAKGFVSIYLYNENCQRDFITKATITIVNCPSIKRELIVSRSAPDWGYSRFVNREDLFNDPVFLATDSLTILCEIKVIEDACELSCEKSTSKKKTTLQEDMGGLLKNSDFCDAALLVGQREFKVHKVILAARSSVFAAMFSHNFQESQTNTIIIEDVSPKIMEEVIHYIYTDRFPKLKLYAEEVLPIADRYALLGLKDICADELCSRLTVDTAAHLLYLADVHSVVLLKECVTNFIVINSKAVVATQSWREMESNRHPLVTEVALAAFSKLH